MRYKIVIMNFVTLLILILIKCNFVAKNLNLKFKFRFFKINEYNIEKKEIVDCKEHIKFLKVKVLFPF